MKQVNDTARSVSTPPAPGAADKERHAAASTAASLRRDDILLAAQQEIAAADSALDTILNIIVRRAQEITDAEGAVVEMLEGDDMLYQAASGTAQAYLGLRLKAAASLSGRCVQEGRPLYCADAETDDRVDREACRRVGVRSMVVVPLTYQRVTQGVLKVYSPQPDAFHAGDVSALQMMVGMIVAGMSNLMMQQQKAELEAMNRRLQRAMTETHHRVKNNLQMISALIEMQSLEQGNVHVHEELQRLNSHIRAMASVHDVLTLQARQDGEANFVSSRAVLAKMLTLIQGMAAGRALHFYAEDTLLSGKHGTSLALITNELALNAIKYGKRALSISFQVHADTAVLEVCDDGPGFDANFDPSQASNTGLMLIESIGKWDMGGEVHYGNRADSPGGKVTVTIPLANLTPPIIA